MLFAIATRQFSTPVHFEALADISDRMWVQPTVARIHMHQQDVTQVSRT